MQEELISQPHTYWFELNHAPSSSSVSPCNAATIRSSLSGYVTHDTFLASARYLSNNAFCSPSALTLSSTFVLASISTQPS